MRQMFLEVFSSLVFAPPSAGLRLSRASALACCTSPESGHGRGKKPQLSTPQNRPLPWRSFSCGSKKGHLKNLIDPIG